MHTFQMGTKFGVNIWICMTFHCYVLLQFSPTFTVVLEAGGTHACVPPAHIGQMYTDTWSRHSIPKTSVFAIEILYMYSLMSYGIRKVWCWTFTQHTSFYLTSYVTDMNYITHQHFFVQLYQPIHWYLTRILTILSEQWPFSTMFVSRAFYVYVYVYVGWLDRIHKFGRNVKVWLVSKQ